MKKILSLISLALLLVTAPAFATTSTINPNNPAQNSPLSSAVLRANFLAAYNDINALWTAVQGGITNGITALTGDVTAAGPGSSVATLATVNTNVGTFGDATHVPQITVNGKGLITGIASITITGGGSTPGGNVGSIQFNNNGALGGYDLGTTIGVTSNTLDISNPPCRQVVTGSTDTILAGDKGACVDYTTSLTGSEAASLPNSATSPFGQGFGTTLNNRTPYAGTVCALVGNIQGTTCINMPANTGCYFYGDGVNWHYDLSQCTMLPIAAGVLPISMRIKVWGNNKDGGGSPPTVPTKMGDAFTIPYPATIIGILITSDLPGNATLGLWKAANYVTPTIINDITGTAPLNLSSSQYHYISDVSGLTSTTVTTGDTFLFYLSADTTITSVTAFLILQGN